MKLIQPSVAATRERLRWVRRGENRATPKELDHSSRAKTGTAKYAKYANKDFNSISIPASDPFFLSRIWRIWRLKWHRDLRKNYPATKERRERKRNFTDSNVRPLFDLCGLCVLCGLIAVGLRLRFLVG